MNAIALNPDLGRLILRISVGGLMLFHGVAKIMHPASLNFISGMLVSNNLPAILAYGVYIGEIVAPLMVIVGYRARLGAVLIFINMLFALFLAHSDELYSLTQHGGWAIELQMFYLLSAASVFFLGSGYFAIKQD